MSSRQVLALAVWIVVSGLSGCCCCSPYGSNYAPYGSNCPPAAPYGANCPPYSGWGGIGNARIAPPATNSYQIAAGSAPYYTPAPGANSTSLNSPNLSGTGLAGPSTSTTSPIGTDSLQTGWRTPDMPNNSGFYGPPNSTNAAPNNATSFQPTERDYQSTAIDERSDSTRLPANDASLVRAPTSFNPTGNWQMLNPATAGGPIQVPGQVEYRATPQVYGSSLQTPANLNVAMNPYALPAFPGQTQTPPVVLAQASTAPNLLASDPNYQAGWRDRFTSGTYMNR